MKTNRYEIKTIADILAIPTDRFEAFMAELPSQLWFLKGVWDIAQHQSKKSDAKVPVELQGFTWIDDGETHTTTTLNGIDPDTGEVAATATITTKNQVS